MGIFKIDDRKRHSMGGSAPTPPRHASDDGRARLRQVAGELAKARDCVADLEAQSRRMQSIISDAEASHNALQQAIAADGGVALAAYGAGKADNQPIVGLIAAKENSAKAASAAKVALPSMEEMLTKARAEVDRLTLANSNEVIHYLKRRAAEDIVAPYHKTFRDLTATHDVLCGVSVALYATGHGEMRTVTTPIQVPGFNTSPGPGPNERIMMQHEANEFKVSDATARWMQAREKLASDPDAQIDDLIGAPEFR